jgi:hypothetical protein
MLRVTELESRLASMRTFLGTLLAHLEDNGLIDRPVLEADFWSLRQQSPQGERADADMRQVFAQADVLLRSWQARRDAEPPLP